MIKTDTTLWIWVGDVQAAFVTAVFGKITLEDMELISKTLRCDDAEEMKYFWSEIPKGAEEVKCTLAWDSADEHYIEGGEVKSRDIYWPLFVEVRAIERKETCNE